MIINAIGATTTGIVLVIVSITKFRGGAWIVIAAMPVIVAFFSWVHRHYAAVARQLRRGTVTAGETHPNHVILLVDDVDPAAAEALGYVRAIRPTEVRAVHIGEGPAAEAVRGRWRDITPSGPALELVLPGRSLLGSIRAYVRGFPREPDAFLTVVIPEIVRGDSLIAHLLRRWSLFRLKVGLLRERNIVVTDVPVHVEGDTPVDVDARPLIPTRTVVLVFVSGVHDASVRAVNYAASLEAAEVRAVFFALDPESSGEIVEEWAQQLVPIELDVVEAPFRDLSIPLMREIRRETARPDTVVSVVMPELIVRRWWHFFLHNQSSLFIKRQLLFEPRAILSSVPYVLE
jgi:hypothetical protein